MGDRPGTNRAFEERPSCAMADGRRYRCQVGRGARGPLVRRAEARPASDTPNDRRMRDPGSGMAAERKSVALFTLPTMTEKLPVSRAIWLLEKTDSGIEKDNMLGFEPTWFV